MKHADGIDELFECVALTIDYNPNLMEQLDRQVLSYSSIPRRRRVLGRTLTGIALLLALYGISWIVLASFFPIKQGATGYTLDEIYIRYPPHLRFPKPLHQFFEPAYRIDRAIRPSHWFPDAVPPSERKLRE